MNIIKLKDIIKDGDDLFNEHLKGRYAFWIHMRYIVSFDHMDYPGYIACENDISKLLENKCEEGCPCHNHYPYIDVYENCDIYEYIDSNETDNINSISDLKIKNEYVTDPEITVDELKKFRTWLATTLLAFDQGPQGGQLYIKYDNDTTLMLTYYMRGMIDDVIETLTSMKMYEKESADIILKDCGCCCNSQPVNTLYNINTIGCDPISQYRHYIYNKMVLTFSEIEFWKQFPSEFILEFKRYIDNIIKVGFELYKTQYIPDLVDCGAISNNDKEQNANVYILRKLSESLQFIVDNDINSHKNYIGAALHEWSSLLYEMMEW